ncbi:hypothetical protein TrRE_jg11617 [Triparma retinervis]|uniref:Uncharacterized protein n=1 Tax=Triparma retinervis TaxID=2557542 RepID=A0A9W7CES1_9STRA|nr:hypothetical protein TrRE_jg11617 [Triparma retinervis]
MARQLNVNLARPNTSAPEERTRSPALPEASPPRPLKVMTAECTITTDRQCSPCVAPTYSDDGLMCKQYLASFCKTAKAGHIPSPDRTTLITCPKNTFSIGADNTPTEAGLLSISVSVSAARSSFTSGSYSLCVSLCISSIKTIRAVITSPLSSPQAAEMYELMGDAYREMGERKMGRAANCYLLSLKEGGEGGEGRRREGDIERLLSNHRLLGTGEEFKFNCTGCGECCRTADNILLTPYDLFNMTRSENLGTDTKGLRGTDGRFGKAVKYMLKDDVPVCYLSPVNSGIGRCHFSYELVKVGGRVLSYKEGEEVRRKMEEEEEEYVPVTSDEYNLTEEEEMEAISGLEIGGDEDEDEEDKDEEEDDEDGGNGGGDEDEGYRAVEQPHESLPIPVMNSYSKPALGCMLGVSGMPSMCAAYPVANESVWGDFWHGRDEGEEKRLDELEYGEGRRGGGGGVEREKFVVVENEVCEGFFEEGRKKTEAYDVGGGGGKDEKESTVGDFLRSGTNLQAKEEEKAWFLALHKKATLVKIRDPDVRKAFVEHVARIWFNFDSLPTARNRPFKSWSRCKKILQECTDVIIEQTKKFGENEEEWRGGEGTAGRRYKELLKRLNL